MFHDIAQYCSRLRTLFTIFVLLGMDWVGAAVDAKFNLVVGASVKGTRPTADLSRSCAHGTAGNAVSDGQAIMGYILHSGESRGRLSGYSPSPEPSQNS
ncbi:hypothetical protein AVEN_251177-1 [Araneus ventricosus]|uniref:Uncharacterized protein n=1 Tax=Araneus ventricosus TaxID=182803 RepID=A0A4Y2UZF9_ARAVE|nr:hypothetical protein AVEN_251177-1 [Araneus ventricosus]